jgi:hypothetical protein
MHYTTAKHVRLEPAADSLVTGYGHNRGGPSAADWSRPATTDSSCCWRIT